MRLLLLFFFCANVAFAAERHDVVGRGFLVDSSHPNRPGDARKIDVALKMSTDASRGDASIELSWQQDGKTESDRWLIRDGRALQLDEKGSERAAEEAGDLKPEAIAALDPQLIAYVLRNRPERAQDGLLAWNDALWRVQRDAKSNAIQSIARRVYSELFGDGAEEIRFEEYRDFGGVRFPARIVVRRRGKDVARFNVESVAPRTTMVDVPRGERAERVVSAEELKFRELAPGIFSIDLATSSSRIVIGEFADFVVVLEGAYNSRICDLVAETVRSRFGKPIRYFAFSHLHGQYVGGVRSFIHAGATVLVPPSTAPLITEIAASKHELRPDALSREAKKARIETVDKKLTIADDANAMEVLSIESGHTDEYFVFYFPRQKALIAGDLLCYRGADQPLRARTRKLVETVTKLGLDVETLFPSWPLDGYGCQDAVKMGDLRAAAAKP